MLLAFRGVENIKKKNNKRDIRWVCKQGDMKENQSKRGFKLKYKRRGDMKVATRGIFNGRKGNINARESQHYIAKATKSFSGRRKYIRVG